MEKGVLQKQFTIFSLIKNIRTLSQEKENAQSLLNLNNGILNNQIVF